MRICIEGPSAAGKSTLAAAMSLHLRGFKVCPTVDCFMDGFPICESQSQIEDNFEKYLLGEIAANRMMKIVGGDWIQDRNWVSQITFLEAVEGLLQVSLLHLKNYLVESLASGEICVPSSMIYRRCPSEITKARRIMRGSSEWGDVPPWIEGNLKHSFRLWRFKQYEDFMMAMFPGSLVLDAQFSCEEALMILDENRMLEIFEAPTIINRLRMRFSKNLIL